MMAPWHDKETIQYRHGLVTLSTTRLQDEEWQTLGWVIRETTLGLFDCVVGWSSRDEIKVCNNMTWHNRMIESWHHHWMKNRFRGRSKNILDIQSVRQWVRRPWWLNFNGILDFGMFFFPYFLFFSTSRSRFSRLDCRLISLFFCWEEWLVQFVVPSLPRL